MSILRLVALHRLHEQHARLLAQFARETDQPMPSAPATAAGDSRRLRGIPIMAPGVGSTLAGTDPLAALLAKERRGA